MLHVEASGSYAGSIRHYEECSRGLSGVRGVSKRIVEHHNLGISASAAAVSMATEAAAAAAAAATTAARLGKASSHA
jgi:hypothetical protein